MSEHFILNDDHSVTAVDLMTWATEFEKRENRRLARDELPDGTVISTVFLGLDHSFGGGPPLLFETMIFPSSTNFDEQYCDRYSTWDEAMAGHAKAVAQAIDARSGETTKIGSTEGESAVVADDAPITGMGKSDQEGA